MIRELNLTNRASMLNRFDAWLFMVKDAGLERARWDVRVKLRMDAIAELNLTEEWECWVDVYKSSTVESFKLGDGKLKNVNDDRFATHFDADVYPLLRIKLVAKNDPLHKILASKDRINPQTIDATGKKEHLLPVRYEDLGQIPWKVRDPAGTRPVLVVNSNLHRPNETVEALVRDRFFCALVLPEAYRQILRARLFGSGMIDKDDIWLKFTAQLVSLNDLTDESTDAEKDVVIDLAVKTFCERHQMIAAGAAGEDLAE